MVGGPSCARILPLDTCFATLGGLIMAHFGDRSGRKQVFLFSILLIGFCDDRDRVDSKLFDGGLAGTNPSSVPEHDAGAAIGGEARVLGHLSQKHVAPRHLALACSFMSSSLLAGVLMASLVTMAVHSFFSPAAMLDYGWRVPFVVAGVLGLLGALFGAGSAKHPIPTGSRAARHCEAAADSDRVAQSLEAISISVVATWILSAVVIVTTLMTPLILQKQYHFDPQAALAISAFDRPLLCGGHLRGLRGRSRRPRQIFHVASLSVCDSQLSVLLLCGSCKRQCVSVVRSVIFFQWHGRSDPMLHGSGFSWQCSFHWHFAVVQRDIRSFRRAYTSRDRCPLPTSPCPTCIICLRLPSAFSYWVLMQS